MTAKVCETRGRGSRGSKCGEDSAFACLVRRFLVSRSLRKEGHSLMNKEQWQGVKYCRVRKGIIGEARRVFG